MTEFFGVVGAIAILLLLLSVTMSVFAVLCAVAERAYDKWRHDIIYRRDAELGEILKSGAYWLSSYPEQEALIRFLGNEIQGGHSWYAGHWRDSWERLRKENAAREKNPQEPKR